MAAVLRPAGTARGVVAEAGRGAGAAGPVVGAVAGAVRGAGALVVAERGTGAAGLRMSAVAGFIGRVLSAAWRYLREVSGDDAYERYLAHHTTHHAGETPLTSKEYFAERQRQKWTGVTRCC